MINFSNLKSIVTPKGEIIKISKNNQVLWEKQTLPYKTELKYIESTGTQWIDIGINKLMTRKNDKISVGFEPLNVSSSGYLFGIMVGSRGGAIRTRGSNWLQASIWQGGGPSEANVDTIYKKFDIEISTTEGFILDGVLQAAAGTGAMTMLGVDYFPLCIGAYVSASGQAATTYTVTPTKGRYYYLKIEQAGVLVRDMIPVLDWTDTPCMYDHISKELFYNNGTGNFIYANHNGGVAT